MSGNSSHLRRAFVLSPIVLIAAISVVVLMAVQSAAGAAVVPSSTGTSYSPVAGLTPNPYMEFNATFTNWQFSTPTSYLSTSGGVSSWVPLYGGADPHVLNPYSVNWGQIAAPLQLTKDPLPGMVLAGPCTTGSTAYQQSLCKSWQNTTFWASGAAYGSTAALSNLTQNGQKVIQLSVNASATQKVAEAWTSIEINTSAIQALSVSPSNTYVDLSYEGVALSGTSGLTGWTEGGCGGAYYTGAPGASFAVEPFVANSSWNRATNPLQTTAGVISADMPLSTGVYMPTVNCTSDQVQPYTDTVDAMPGLTPWGSTTTGSSGQFESDASAVGSNQSGFLSLPWSLITSGNAGFNETSSSTTPCPTSGTQIKGCTNELEIGAMVVAKSNSTTAGAFELKVTGLSITTDPVSFGSTATQHSRVYSSCCVHPTWDNVTLARNLLGPYSAPNSFVSPDPSFSSPAWDNGTSATVAMAYPASALTNVTGQCSGNGNTGGSCTWIFPFGEPPTGSVAYSAQNHLWDSSLPIAGSSGVSYVTVVNGGSSVGWAYGGPSSNVYPPLAPTGSRFQVPTRAQGVTCASQSLVAGTTCDTVNVQNDTVTYVIAYTGAQLCDAVIATPNGLVSACPGSSGGGGGGPPPPSSGPTSCSDFTGGSLCGAWAWLEANAWTVAGVAVAVLAVVVAVVVITRRK